MHSVLPSSGAQCRGNNKNEECRCVVNAALHRCSGPAGLGCFSRNEGMQPYFLHHLYGVEGRLVSRPPVSRAHYLRNTEHCFLRIRRQRSPPWWGALRQRLGSAAVPLSDTCAVEGQWCSFCYRPGLNASRLRSSVPRDPPPFQYVSAHQSIHPVYPPFIVRA